jgi:tetratricopeptide (TPR) repeat protein
MRRCTITALAVILLLGTGGNAAAQMDMLPQIFRDLPPELQQGLPEDMSYEEYRELNRNVDFFTMFMSMWVPGYGLFQVERPDLAWNVVGARAVGYGMMAAAMFLQWDNMRDLGRLSSLSDAEFKRALGNIMLFSGGVIINGLGWAADVLAAYHIATREEGFVIYKYGLKAGIDGRDAEQRNMEYIRKLILQEDPYLSDDLLMELQRYVNDFPEGEHLAEAEFYLGTVYAGRGFHERALLHFSRVLLFHPNSRFAAESRRQAVRLAQEHREKWRADWRLLMNVLQRETGRAPAESGELFSRYLEGLARFRTPAFQELFVEEARRFSLQYQGHAFADDALWSAAGQLEKMGRYQEAVITLTELAYRFPEAERWAPAMLRIGMLLEEQLNAPSYAEPFFERLVERQPDSRAAERARSRLE